jgi:hypothetical protein
MTLPFVIHLQKKIAELRAPLFSFQLKHLYGKLFNGRGTLPLALSALGYVPAGHPVPDRRGLLFGIAFALLNLW